MDSDQHEADRGPPARLTAFSPSFPRHSLPHFDNPNPIVPPAHGLSMPHWGEQEGLLAVDGWDEGLQILGSIVRQWPKGS